MSSQNVGDHSNTLLRLVGNKKSVLYIPNARDDWNDSESRDKSKKHQLMFESLGFTFRELDLKDYFGIKKISKQMLSGYGLIWASGGNTFLLRKAMSNSGLDKVLDKLVISNQVVYGGSSAGSILPTPSLDGVDQGDDPAQVKAVYNQTTDWTGLNWVPFHFVPHYKSEWFGTEAQSMVDYFETCGLPYKALRDGEVYVIDGEKEELLP